MNDYSKPIGWWCPDCGAEVRDIDTAMNHLDYVVGHDPTMPGDGDCPIHICNGGQWCIPVYAVIPGGERPEGETRAEMEASAEVVVAVDFEGHVRLCPADDQGPETGDGFYAGRWVLMGKSSCWAWTFSDDDGANDVADLTEADAILFIVEGRLPE